MAEENKKETKAAVPQTPEQKYKDLTFDDFHQICLVMYERFRKTNSVLRRRLNIDNAQCEPHLFKAQQMRKEYYKFEFTTSTVE